jgi:hypothetical protein
LRAFETTTLLAVLLSGCGASPYGHAPSYAPVDAERSLLTREQPIDFSSPAHWGDIENGTLKVPKPGRALTLFGVVESRDPGPRGQAILRLSLRQLEPRNTCARRGDADSCRTTVSEASSTFVWALVALRDSDDVGPLAVGRQSLLRIVGEPGQETPPSGGGAVIHVAWYRHWPSAEYFTAPGPPARR